MLYSALLGNPVDHSVSPVLFRIFAEKANIEYAHLKINIPSKDRLHDSLVNLKKLGFCGINITLPYKLDIKNELDEISVEARKIGAVNTVVFKKNKMIGYNTDARGALLTIEKKLRPILKSDKILVIGAGGAARAVIFELFKKCKNVTILNRDIKEANKISSDFSFEANKINVEILSDENLKKNLKECNFIINTTPVGMYPQNDDRIISKKVFSQFKDLKGKYFFDVIFNPYKTTFLVDAEKRGAKISSGTYMMIYQAIYAFKLWTGIDLKRLNIEEINNELIVALQRH